MSTLSKTTKNPDWSAPQLLAIETAFLALPKGTKLNNDDVKVMVELEIFNNKNVNELRGKIVSDGYYKAAAKVAVGSGGVKVVRKMEYVTAIEILAGLTVGSLASFEKGSKPQLEALNGALTGMSDRFNADLIGSPDTVTVKTKLITKLEEKAGLETGSLKSLLKTDVKELQLLVGKAK